MTGAPCVKLTDPQNTIQFVLRIRFSPWVNNLAPYPVMQFYYNIGNGQEVGYTDPAGNDDIVLTTLDDGTLVNEVSYTINVSVKSLCMVDSNFMYNIQYQFIDGGTMDAYPIYAHPDLFPHSIFDIPHTQAEYEIITLTKNVCCYDYNYTCISMGNFGFSSSQNTANPQTESTLEERFAAYPNPFDNTIELGYQLERAGEIHLVCLDANGKRMAQQAIRHESAGDYNWTFSTDDWPAGMYFVRLLRGNEVQTLKVIKLD